MDTHTPRLRQGVSVMTQEEVVSVLEPSSGKLFVTNVAGRVILDLCDGRMTASDISERVASEFGEPPVDVIREDVSSFLAECQQKGVVEWQR